MKCPACGKENPAGEQYCVDCGSDLTAQPASPAAASTAGAPAAAGSGSLAMSDEEFQRLLHSPTVSTCPHCGAPAPATGNYCDSCGEPLTSSASPSAGATASTGAAADGQSAPPAAADAAAQAPANAQAPAQAPTPAQAGGAADATEKATERIAAEAAPAPPAAAPISFELSGPSSSGSYTMTGDEAHVGRRDADAGIYPEIDFDGNDVVVDAGERVHAVSRRHGRIFREGDVLKYEDVGSTNGSTLNGTPVLAHDPQPLKDGDHIVLGRTCRITVHIAPAAPSSP